MAEICVRVRVTGRVQGVWFRGWTKDHAGRLGLRGWVRNEADGSVTALIGGSEPAVDELLAAMHRGPEAARVTSMKVEPADEAPPDGFSITR
ncbi:MAG: acylphosphatase [Rhodobacter sp.]|nr:acylphosphatase [Rhodobacter sp.]